MLCDAVDWALPPRPVLLVREVHLTFGVVGKWLLAGWTQIGRRGWRRRGAAAAGVQYCRRCAAIHSRRRALEAANPPARQVVHPRLVSSRRRWLARSSDPFGGDDVQQRSAGLANHRGKLAFANGRYQNTSLHKTAPESLPSAFACAVLL